MLQFEELGGRDTRLPQDCCESVAFDGAVLGDHHGPSIRVPVDGVTTFGAHSDEPSDLDPPSWVSIHRERYSPPRHGECGSSVTWCPARRGPQWGLGSCRSGGVARVVPTACPVSVRLSSGALGWTVRSVEQGRLRAVVTLRSRVVSAGSHKSRVSSRRRGPMQTGNVP